MATDSQIDPGAPRRALLTGASGFIGSNLVRRLLAGKWDVHIIVRPGSSLDALKAERSALTCHEHDGSAQGMHALMERVQPDVVFHLASLFLAQHTPDNLADLVTSNVLFSTQLVDAMVKAGVKYLVNTGTAWQHYEDAPYRPVNLYAATKQAFEDILSYYVDAFDLKVTTLALFDTYGRNDPRAKLMALLWKTALEQRPLAMSPGEQQIDIVHVDDVVSAFVQAANLLPTQTAAHARYGLSSGRPMRLSDLVALFEAATGYRLPIQWGERPYRAREVMVPWKSFAMLPGWNPQIALEDGIRDTHPTNLP